MTTNCPLCGRHLTPMDSPENRIILKGMDLPICNVCAEKKYERAKTKPKAKTKGKITGIAASADVLIYGISAEIEKLKNNCKGEGTDGRSKT